MQTPSQSFWPVFMWIMTLMQHSKRWKSVKRWNIDFKEALYLMFVLDLEFIFINNPSNISFSPFFCSFILLGNFEWPILGQKSWRGQFFNCTIERWIPWKCSPFYLWDLLPHSSAHWHGVCNKYLSYIIWNSFEMIISAPPNIIKHINTRQSLFLLTKTR